MSNKNESVPGVSRRQVLQTGAVAVGTLGLAVPAAATGNGVITETEDVFGQGMDGDVVAEDGATIRRTKNGVSINLSMPTPEPGTYTYPSGPEDGAWTDEEGPPEVFTLWCFVFDDPNEDWTGVYNPAGKMVGGSTLTLSGRASRDINLFAGEPLENPRRRTPGSRPHGALDPELLPEALNTPTGPGPDIWWLALFDPPA
jgi:hypothetical protein